MTPRVPVPHPSVEWELFDDDGFQIVLFDSRAGRPVLLNGASSAVWYLCDGKSSDVEIVDAVVESFGLEHGEASRGVAEALAEFAAAGLLEGATTSAQVSQHPRGLLPRVPDPCGASTAQLGWTETVELVVAGWLVGVRAGSRRIAEAIRLRHSERLASSAGVARTNFGVRRAAPLFGRYEVYNAGVRVARARTLPAALNVLDELLGGVSVFGSEPAGLVSCDIGLVTRSDAAVLIDVEGLKCTDRRWALDLLEGSRPTWRVLVDPVTARVHVPPVMGHSRPLDDWESFWLAGIVLSERDGGPPPLQRVYDLGEGERSAWFTGLPQLKDRVVEYRDLDTARPAVAGLVARGPIAVS